MDFADGFIAALIGAGGLGLVGWLSYRLLRWARSGTGGAHALGAVLTEVTQSPAVHEAKQGEKLRNGEAGDPPPADAARADRGDRGCFEPEPGSGPSSRSVADA